MRFWGLFIRNLKETYRDLMALAFLLSVCSEADAFVAASFAGLPAAAHLAFAGAGQSRVPAAAEVDARPASGHGDRPARARGARVPDRRARR